MVKPSGPRRSAPEVELCIPVIDEESTKGRRISMMITMHLLMDAPKSTLGPIGRLGDDLHDVRQSMASNMLGFIRNHWEGGYCIKEQVAQAVKTNHNSPERTGGVDDNTPGAGEVAGQDVSLDAGSSDSGGGLGSGGGGGSAPSSSGGGAGANGDTQQSAGGTAGQDVSVDTCANDIDGVICDLVLEFITEDLKDQSGTKAVRDLFDVPVGACVGLWRWFGEHVAARADYPVLFEKSWFVKAAVAWTQEVHSLEQSLNKKTETESDYKLNPKKLRLLHKAANENIPALYSEYLLNHLSDESTDWSIMFEPRLSGGPKALDSLCAATRMVLRLTDPQYLTQQELQKKDPLIMTGHYELIKSQMTDEQLKADEDIIQCIASMISLDTKLISGSARNGQPSPLKFWKMCRATCDKMFEDHPMRWPWTPRSN